MVNVPWEEDGKRTHFLRSFSCDARSNGCSFVNVIRRTCPIFLFFLYIKNYATWCRLSQQKIVPILTIGLTFNLCRVSLVSSSSSRQRQTSAGGNACSRLPRMVVLPRTHRGQIAPQNSTHHPRLLFVPVRGLTIVLCLGLLAVALPSGVVNMVNNQEE